MKTPKSNSILLLLPLSLLLLIAACTKEGFEGDSNITGKVAHHGARISEATVFIKFNAKEFPGSLVSDFDASVVADTGGNYLIEGLKKGDYYLYGFGYDSTIHQNVKGGLHVKLEAGEVRTLEVPVTE